MQTKAICARLEACFVPDRLVRRVLNPIRIFALSLLLAVMPLAAPASPMNAEVAGQAQPLQKPSHKPCWSSPERMRFSR